MKRIILFIIALSCFSVAAYAELPNISNLTTDELHELQTMLINELGERKELPAFTAPISTYEAGKDFPIGKYTITSPGFCTIINIYDDKQSYISNTPVIRDTYIYGDFENAIVFDFKNGSFVDVSFASARFEPYTGLLFE